MRLTTTSSAAVNNRINIVNHDKTKKKHLSIAIPSPRRNVAASLRIYQETREETNSRGEESNQNNSRREDPNRKSKVIPNQRRNALKDNGYKISWRNKTSSNNKRRTTNDARKTKSNHRKSDPEKMLQTPNAQISTATTPSKDTTTFSIDPMATNNAMRTTTIVPSSNADATERRRSPRLLQQNEQEQGNGTATTTDDVINTNAVGRRVRPQQWHP